MSMTTKVNYFIDKANGVIVAELTGYSNETADTAPLWECAQIHVFHLMKGVFWFDKTDDENYVKKHIMASYKGKAVLSEGDIWDEEKGMRIARSKAQAKYMSALHRFLDDVEERVKKNVLLFLKRIDDSKLHCALSYSNAISVVNTEGLCQKHSGGES